MPTSSKFKAILFIFFAVIFMFQENNAQPKKTKGKTKTPVVTEVKVVPPEVNYTVSMSKPWTHLLEVEMRIKQSQMPEKSELAMPVWTPGSYLVREYARHLQDFSAKDTSGKILNWAKVNKNTWQIETKGLSEYVVTYNVYANELTVRTNELNDIHAFWNNGALLLFPKGHLNIPTTLSVKPYGNWKIATGLPKVEGKENTFFAENYDVLYDSPFEVSDFKEISFEVQGKPHRFVVTGEGNYNLEKIAKDTTKLVEASSAIFGDLPYKDYLFILNTRGGGGLEHLNSTALQFNKFGFITNYNNFLSLVAHEFFHLWNVKRIKPDVLGPFNYEGENYTKLLWVAEGGTAYYESVIMQRAGLISDKDFLANMAAQIQSLQERPGRFQTSLEEASFDAWIKYYRPDENSVNNQISYYDKGELVNFLLDLKIRQDSKGTKSLDDVMRHLYNEFAKKGKNYSPEDLQKTSELMSGTSLNDFFGKYVRGREEIDYDSIFNAFGLKLDVIKPKSAAYLGATLRQDGDRLNVTALPSTTPAYEQGLNTGDQIIAIDGLRASQQFLQTYLGEKKAGDKVKLTVFRFDELKTFEITLGDRTQPTYRISTMQNLTEEQKMLYKGKFGVDLK